MDLSQVVEKLQELGFLYVTLDLEGYRSGKLNRVLQRRETAANARST
jgi:uncharacterized protein